jgi:hypothetical protein
MVAELLEWRGQRIGRGRVAGLDPCDESRRLVVGDGEGPQRAAGVLQLAAGVLQLAVVDAAQVNRVESGVSYQLGGDRLGLLVAGQEQDPGRLAVVVVGHDVDRERVEGARPARPRERAGQRPQ